ARDRCTHRREPVVPGVRADRHRAVAPQPTRDTARNDGADRVDARVAEGVREGRRVGSDQRRRGRAANLRGDPREPVLRHHAPEDPRFGRTAAAGRGRAAQSERSVQLQARRRASSRMTAPSITTGHFVRVAPDVRLHYASCGEPGKPLMLLLHGFPEFWYAWRAVLPAFGARFHAVAPDLRGYNLSDKPADVRAYRASVLVSDIDA